MNEVRVGSSKDLVTVHGPCNCTNSERTSDEQAIAATVGSGRAEDVIRQLIARLSVAADFHFATKYVDCIVEEYSGKLATLGRGTCKLTQASWDDGTCTWGCICSACDAHLEHETGIGYNFCPNCGRKVVDE